MIDTGDKTITRQAVLDAIAEQAAILQVTPEVSTAEQLLDFTKLFEDVESATGCHHDWVLISDSHFEEWCEDYANGMGPTSGWPYDCIDWTKAADALKQDYKQVSFSDETYWVRA
jgi:hypothetical protein